MGYLFLGKRANSSLRVYPLKPYVMRSMKRDHKSANVNFEIVNYVVDDCLPNIKKKKVYQKVQKSPS